MERAEYRKPALRVWSSPVGHIPREYGSCEKPQYEPRSRKSIEQVATDTRIPENVQMNSMPASGSMNFATQAVQEVFS